MHTSLETYKATAQALKDLVFFFTENHYTLNRLPQWVYDKSSGGIDFSKYPPLLEQAQQEIHEFEDRQRALEPRAMDYIKTEDYILTHSALRISGYDYQRCTDLNPHEVIDTFYKTKNFEHATPLDKLACLFFLQRSLCKWGGETLPGSSPEWNAYRTLFLDTFQVEVPLQFQPASDLTNIWEYRIKPNLSNCVGIVRSAHEETIYPDF